MDAAREEWRGFSPPILGGFRWKFLGVYGRARFYFLRFPIRYPLMGILDLGGCHSRFEKHQSIVFSLRSGCNTGPSVGMYDRGSTK